MKSAAKVSFEMDQKSSTPERSPKSFAGGETFPKECRARTVGNQLLLFDKPETPPAAWMVGNAGDWWRAAVPSSKKRVLGRAWHGRYWERSRYETLRILPASHGGSDWCVRGSSEIRSRCKFDSRNSLEVIRRRVDGWELKTSSHHGKGDDRSIIAS